MKKQLLGERKKFNKATEELDELQESKRELESELKARNEEIYQVNEKLMNMELMLNSSSSEMNDKKALIELQGKFEKAFEINARRSSDMQRLKTHLERLRCDFNLISQSKRQGKLGTANDSEEGAQQEASMDSDRMVNEQISNTLEHIQRIIDANLQLEDGQSKMDTTMMSDVGDYLNILPDMVDRMDIEESSFL
jgi:chromosome segregation ATPase